MYRPMVIDFSNIPSIFSYDTIFNHYQLYLESLDMLNGLLSSVGYDYNLPIDKLISKIDTFDLKMRGEILYYLSSVLNHELYFKSIFDMEYVGSLRKNILKYYGDFNSFRNEFFNISSNLKGSGYVFLVRDGNDLRIINTSVEDNPFYFGFEPIIALDLWEHAYYLDYKKRKDYINSYLELINSYINV